MQPPARFRPPVTTAYRSSRHETSEWQVTWQQDTNSRSPGHVTTPTPAVGHVAAAPRYLFFVTTAVTGRVSDAELARCACAFDETAPALVAAVLAADLLPARERAILRTVYLCPLRRGPLQTHGRGALALPGPPSRMIHAGGLG